MEGMIESSLRLLANEDFKLPPKQFEHCFGIVIIEAVEVGFLINAQIGSGILLRHDKLNQSWSSPLAIGLTGVGAGISMGAEKKHMIIFLTREHMTQAMSSDFSLRLGCQTSLVVMDVGEEMDLTPQIGNKGGIGTTSGYTSTLGFYFGVEANGAVLAPRSKVNETFYGQKIKPQKIVFGTVEDLPPCESLDRLHAKLFQLAEAPPLKPSYAEAIAHPFLKTTKHTEHNANAVKTT